jgi:hypothetical protein
MNDSKISALELIYDCNLLSASWGPYQEDGIYFSVLLMWDVRSSPFVLPFPTSRIKSSS